MKLVLTLLVLGAPVYAAELALLRNGAVLRADRIEKTTDRVILYSASGRTELAAGEIESFETVTEPPPVALLPLPEQSTTITPPAKLKKSVSELLNDAAERHGVPVAFIRSVAGAESAFQPNAVSHKGAIGVMQLMPETARKFEADPRDTEQNIDAGTRLLRDLLLKYQNDPNPVRRALAAYNAGEGAVQKYGGVPPYRETQIYVERVLQRYWKEVKLSR